MIKDWFTAQSPLRETFSGRRRRKIQEYLVGYLMIAPAMILIFVFGIFPVAFALYVSIHKWLIVRGEFRGLRNYVEAIDDFAYLGLFALGMGALIGAWLLARRLTQQSKDDQFNPRLLMIPAAVTAAAIIAFFRWIYFQLPEVLDIATKMRGLERTRELFTGLLLDAFRAEAVVPVWNDFVGVLLFAIILSILAWFVKRSPNNPLYQARLTILWLAFVIGSSLLYFTYSGIRNVYADAVETGVDPGFVPQLVMITSGFLMLILGWYLWRSSERQNSNLQFALRIFASAILMVGAVLCIIEIPTVVASGDPDLWNGLKVTVFFSAGTVPIQLTIALFLSIILFQKMRGASIFRIIFFLPYVTPMLASITIFQWLFSERDVGPINQLLQLVGIGSQRWLREPNGILSMLANSLGATNYPASIIPRWFPEDLATLLGDWLLGPSQALIVVIMHSIWMFVGYNVVIYLAGLGNIPTELTEAAEIDGASKWGVFRHVTFPLLSPTTYFLSLIAVMGTFKAFNTIWLLRQSVGTALGTIETFSVVIFEEFFIKTRYGYASAMAFVLFAIILGLTYLNNRIQGSRVFYG
jgi:multiple sugar transport system permease protein